MANMEADMGDIQSKPDHAKRVNVTLPADVYEEGKVLELNFSRVFEQALREAIRVERLRRWSGADADFIAFHNEFVEKHGLPLAKYRMF